MERKSLKLKKGFSTGRILHFIVVAWVVSILFLWCMGLFLSYTFVNAAYVSLRILDSSVFDTNQFALEPAD